MGLLPYFPAENTEAIKLQFNIAKLTWAKSVTYWYEYKLNEEELKAYQKDGTTPETFFDDGEVVGEEENHWDVEVNLVLEEGDEQ